MKTTLRTCLAVLVGIAIGVGAMLLIRPREVKAQGTTVFVDYSLSGNAQGIIKPRGSRIIGFACGSGSCFIASE